MEPVYDYTSQDFSGLKSIGKAILDFIFSPQLQEKLFPLKILFVLISIGFLVMIIYFLSSTEYLEWKFFRFIKDFLKARLFGRKNVAKKWHKIRDTVEKGRTEEKWKEGVIKAALLFDKILTKMDFQGEELVEKASQLTSQDISNLKELIRVCGTCQDIIKDPDYYLTKDKAEEILNIFEKAMKDLQII